MNNPYQAPEANLEQTPKSRFDQEKGDLEVFARPWLSIWLRPRATTRYLVAAQPTRRVLGLALLNGLVQNLAQIDEHYLEQGFDLGTVLLAAVLIAPVSGWLALFSGAALLRWSGSWLGGRANQEQLRCAMAWSWISSVPLLLIYGLQLLLFGEELFSVETPLIDASPVLSMSNLTLNIAEVGMVLWSVVLFLCCTAEVQGFSVWRALVSTVLSFTMAVAAILALAFLIVLPFVFSLSV